MELMEKQLSSERIYDGKVISVRKDMVELPNGEIGMREFVEHRGGVCILAQKENGQIPCVRQYRYGQSKVLLELPAGKLEKDEDPLNTAKRELQEETGYQADEFVFMGEFVPTGAYLQEKIYLYYAKGLSWSGQHFDEDEFLQLEEYTLDELVEMVLSQEISDGKTMALVLKIKMMKERGLL